MMNIIPNIIEGAVVFDLVNDCQVKSKDCLHCARLLVLVHNWAKTVNLEYFIFDLQEEKDICEAFLDEVIQLRKRLRHPFLFAGALGKSREILESYSCGNIYPLFLTPEDAIRALRMQHPGLTEVPLKGLLDSIGKPFLSPAVKQIKEENCYEEEQAAHL